MLNCIFQISEGNISSKVVTRITKPFAYYLCNGQDSRLCFNIMKSIFTHLIKQTDLGIEYADKELAWRNVCIFLICIYKIALINKHMYI